MKQPDEIEGGQTQTIYVVVTDADAAYARAKAGGSKIAMAIRDEDYGGRAFSCYDLEGHLWSFGMRAVTFGDGPLINICEG